jgi:hypothetical protein
MFTSNKATGAIARGLMFAIALVFILTIVLVQPVHSQNTQTISVTQPLSFGNLTYVSASQTSNTSTYCSGGGVGIDGSKQANVGVLFNINYSATNAVGGGTWLGYQLGLGPGTNNMCPNTNLVFLPSYPNITNAIGNFVINMSNMPAANILFLQASNGSAVISNFTASYQIKIMAP